MNASTIPVWKHKVCDRDTHGSNGGTQIRRRVIVYNPSYLDRVSLVYVLLFQGCKKLLLGNKRGPNYNIRGRPYRSKVPHVFTVEGILMESAC